MAQTAAIATDSDSGEWLEANQGTGKRTMRPVDPARTVAPSQLLRTRWPTPDMTAGHVTYGRPPITSRAAWGRQTPGRTLRRTTDRRGAAARVTRRQIYTLYARLRRPSRDVMPMGGVKGCSGAACKV